MIIPTFEAFIEQVNPIGKLKNGTRFQTFVIQVPEPVNGWGQAVGTPDYFEGSVFGQKIDQLPKLKKGDLVKVSATLSGRTKLDNNNSRVYYRQFWNFVSFEKMDS